jgi:hypothetical protein
MAPACAPTVASKPPPKIHYTEATRIANDEAARIHKGVRPNDTIYGVKPMFNYDNRRWSVIYHRRRDSPTVGPSEFCILVDDNTGRAWLSSESPKIKQ